MTESESAPALTVSGDCDSDDCVGSKPCYGYSGHSVYVVACGKHPMLM
jgi:hypothetical protein